MWGYIIFLICWCLGAGAVIFFIITFMRSHRVRIRDPINTRAYLRDYWVLEKKAKDTGILYWVSVKGKKTFATARPPAKAIDTGPRGRMFAEAYKISEDEFVWIRDKGIKFEKDDKGKPIIVDVEKDGSHKVIDTFKPFGTVPREVLVSQYKKAQEMRMKRWTADKIVSLTAIMGFIVMLTMLMIFWGDLAQPILAMEGRLVEWDQRMETREVRLMELEAKLYSGVESQTPTSSGSNVIIQESETPPTG